MPASVRHHNERLQQLDSRRRVGDIVAIVVAVVVIGIALLAMRGSVQRERRLFEECIADGYAEYQCHAWVRGGWRYRR